MMHKCTKLFYVDVIMQIRFVNFIIINRKELHLLLCLNGMAIQQNNISYCSISWEEEKNVR